MKMSVGQLKSVIREATKRVTYTGVFLDEKSRTELLRWWSSQVGEPLLSGKTFAHHMTIKFKPSDEEVSALQLGSRAALKVVGYASDEKGQAVLVEPSGVVSGNKLPHITISTAPGVAPAYSNELLSKGIKKADGPTLVGTIEVR